MPLSVSPLYAALLTIIYIALSFRVIGIRRGERISLGDGGSEALNRRMRAHGNFAEYVPVALILIMMAELNGTPLWMLHLLGVMLVIGRLLHAYGISTQHFTSRKTGMVLTFMTLLAAAMANIALSPLLAALIS